MAKPILGLMTITTALQGVITVLPTGSTYELDTVISDLDTMLSLSIVVTGANLDTTDVDVFIDNGTIPSGVLHYDTDHFDYVPGAPVSLDPSFHKIVATFTDGIITNEAQLHFTTKSILVPSFTSDSAGKEAPGTIAFTDTSLNTPTTRWRDFGDGHFSNLQNPTHIYYKAGTYDVSLTVTNDYDKETKIETGFITMVETTPGQTNEDHIETAREGVDTVPPLDANTVVETDERDLIEGRN